MRRPGERGSGASPALDQPWETEKPGTERVGTAAALRLEPQRDPGHPQSQSTLGNQRTLTHGGVCSSLCPGSPMGAWSILGLGAAAGT